VDALRSEMISKKIMYRDITGTDKEISFTLLNPTENAAAIREIVRKVDPDIEIKESEGGKYNITYTEAALKTKKLHLLDQSIQIVNKRVNETGTREPIIQRQGENRIVLQVPGLQDPERLKKLLGETAKMTFHLVDEEASAADASHGSVPAGDMLLYAEGRGEHKESPVPYVLKSKVELGGELLVDAAATFDNRNNEPVVSFRFNAAGAQRFGDISRNNLGKRFAVLDGKVITAPVIQSAILDGSGIISGSFTSETANDLAVLLRSGALPVPIKVVEERSVGPSLGADSINAGKHAALLGVVLVMVFMLVNYGLFGIFANIGLLINLVFILGALSLFQATLTLPGIAGMVLTLGMAVDANVLIYERIREEQRNGKSPFASIESGFRMAQATITDANITTLIAALCLFYFGTGTVKGFAVTLAIGILASMFTAIVLTRLMVSIWLRRTKPKRVPI
jgi:preprotein translocase subunit SecD